MSEAQALNDGSPVVVKLQNGDEVLGIVFTVEDDGLLIERALQVVREPIAETERTITYSIRLEKWIRSAGTDRVPLFDGNVLSIASVTPQMCETYRKWAVEHFDVPKPSEPVSITGEEPPATRPVLDIDGTPLTPDEVIQRDRFFQHILENFESDTLH